MQIGTTIDKNKRTARANGVARLSAENAKTPEQRSVSRILASRIRGEWSALRVCVSFLENEEEIKPQGYDVRDE